LLLIRFARLPLLLLLFAFSRAREQINKSHLKEVQSENKKLKELLREEKMSNQQILRKLSNLQQQKQKKSCVNKHKW
jgi:hypothetical protein